MLSVSPFKRILKLFKEDNNSSLIGKHILNDLVLKRDLARRSLFWFFTLYLLNYIQYPTADFQKEIYDLVSYKDKEDHIEYMTIQF
jgi:hypothetical protein